MSDTSRLPWDELLDLHVVRRTALILAKRWNMGMGWLDSSDRAPVPPRATKHAAVRNVCQVIQDSVPGAQACHDHGCANLDRLAELSGAAKGRAFTTRCHASVSELVAPIVVGGAVVGALTCSAFAGERDRAIALQALDLRAQELALESDRYSKAQQRLPLFDRRELSFASALLEAAAEEIAIFLAPVKARRSRGRAAPPAPTGVRDSYHGIIGRSAPMQELYSILDRVVRSDATVLIQGENGTGKELVARAIHVGSDRADRRFVVTNCSAFNDNLLDSELFGHKKGSFTGAFGDKQGLFEAADTGTFFLDEIGDMSPSLQVKVLRVLQEGTFTPVGDTEMRQVDVRIIAATNRDLKSMVASGAFREDLYYRINVINLRIPPLRERREDIEILVNHFLQKHTERNRRGRKTLSRECLHHLMSYDWPGNVRELENEIERVIVLSGDAVEIDETLLSERLRRHAPKFDLIDIDESTSLSLPKAQASLERRMLMEALERNKWNKTRAADELGISRRNVIRLVKKYELDDYRSR